MTKAEPVKPVPPVTRTLIASPSRGPSSTRAAAPPRAAGRTAAPRLAV